MDGVDGEHTITKLENYLATCVDTCNRVPMMYSTRSNIHQVPDDSQKIKSIVSSQHSGTDTSPPHRPPRHQHTTHYYYSQSDCLRHPGRQIHSFWGAVSIEGDPRSSAAASEMRPGCSQHSITSEDKRSEWSWICGGSVVAGFWCTLHGYDLKLDHDLHSIEENVKMRS